MLGDAKIFGVEGLGALGKCDWNNPCSDLERVIYRLDWYNFQFFKHKTIDLKTFLEIIYQSWLQITMINYKQDKNGYLFRKFGFLGDKYFVAFGGSADSAAKPGNDYFTDARWNRACNVRHSPSSLVTFWSLGRDAADQYFIGKGKVSYLGHTITGQLNLQEFLDRTFNIEAELYTIEWACNDGPQINVLSLMAQFFFNPIGTLQKAYKEMEAVEQAYIDMRDSYQGNIFDNAINPLREQEQQVYKNEAIQIGVVGLIGIVAIGFAFSKMNG